MCRRRGDAGQSKKRVGGLRQAWKGERRLARD